MNGTTISVRVPNHLKKQFNTTLKTLKIDQAEFLRKCIQQVVKEREQFLLQVGFKKTEAWH